MKCFQHKTFVMTVAVILGLVMVQAASAQRRGRGLFGAARIQIATLEQVQAELKMTSEQKALAQQINEKLTEDRRALFQGGGGGDFAAIFADMQKLSNEASAKLAEKLDDAQRKRLTEIFIQVNGTNALVDDEVGKALQVTEQQKKALTDARDENRRASFQAFQDFQNMSDEERQEAVAKLREEGDKRLMAALTEPQREQFAGMKGKEIDLDLSPLFRGRGGGGGRPNRP